MPAADLSLTCSSTAFARFWSGTGIACRVWPRSIWNRFGTLLPWVPLPVLRRFGHTAGRSHGIPRMARGPGGRVLGWSAVGRGVGGGVGVGLRALGAVGAGGDGGRVARGGVPRGVVWVVTEVARLEELRLSVVEGRCAALLELGAHEVAVAELEAHVQLHPLREHSCELLALGLYRSGRQADALEVLRATRRQLAEELG